MLLACVACLVVSLVGLRHSEARPPPGGKAAATAKAKRATGPVGRHWHRVQARGKQAKRWLLQTGAGKAAVRAGKQLGWKSRKLRARLTWWADGLELKLSPRLSRGFHALRSVNPGATGTFAAQKVKNDPVFYASYGILSSTFGKLQTPVMLSWGASVPATLATSVLLGPPLDFAVLTLREHHKRTDRSRSYWGSVKAVGTEYKKFVSDRREENRAFGAQLGLKPRRARGD